MCGWVRCVSRSRKAQANGFFVLMAAVGVFAVIMINSAINSAHASAVQEKVRLSYDMSDKGSAAAALLNSRVGGMAFPEMVARLLIKDDPAVRQSASRLISGLGEGAYVEVYWNDGTRDRVTVFRNGEVTEGTPYGEAAGPDQAFAQLSQQEQSSLKAIGFTWPVRESERLITSGIGSRMGSGTSGTCELHKGIDIGVPEGTDVLAAADGVIEVTGYDEGGFGNYIRLRHTLTVSGVQETLYTYYGHLKQSLVMQGQAVKAGERIAISGNTGRSTGPHLHFEVDTGTGVGRTAADPCPLLGNPAGCYHAAVAQCAVATSSSPSAQPAQPADFDCDIPLPGPSGQGSKARLRVVV
jgi:murein DD-endopeptidase MepM/ murein hydrolase activator NlpD